MAADPAGSEHGFTLLEVLVAFIIAALALAALFSGGLGGLRATAVSGRYQEAVSRAQSHLAAATIGDALTAGDHQGDEGSGFHWRVRITPLGTSIPDPASRGQSVIALYAIGSVVSWTEEGRTRSVQLDTERASAAPAPPPP